MSTSEVKASKHQVLLKWMCVLIIFSVGSGLCGLQSLMEAVSGSSSIPFAELIVGSIVMLGVALYAAHKAIRYFDRLWTALSE